MAKTKAKPHHVGLQDLSTELSLVMSFGVNLPNRTMYLIGEINDELTAQFIKGFGVLDSTVGPIGLVLDSNGGDVQKALVIYDLIRLSKNKVQIDVVGAAFSSAALILQAGDHRTMTPNASVMVHYGQIVVHSDDSFKAEELADNLKSLTDTNAQYVSIISARSKLSEKEVRAKCAKDTYFTPEEALQDGLIDEIRTTRKKA